GVKPSIKLTRQPYWNCVSSAALPYPRNVTDGARTSTPAGPSSNNCGDRNTRSVLLPPLSLKPPPTVSRTRPLGGATKYTPTSGEPTSYEVEVSCTWVVSSCTYDVGGSVRTRSPVVIVMGSAPPLCHGRRCPRCCRPRR